MIVDAFGQRHAPAGPDARIVSLVPSLTELLCDLGLADRLVGRTGFCIHPREQLRGIPKVGGTKDVDLEKVRSLAPTHLVVNVDENEKPAVDAMRAFVPHVIVTHPIEPADNVALYRLFGAIFGCGSRAAELERRLDEALQALAGRRFEPLRVLYLIWKNPWMTVGPDTYIARMLALVGLQAVSPDSARRYPQVDFTDFGADRFDCALLSSEPYRFTQRHLETLGEEPALGARPALLVDGELVSWYGSRAIAGVACLARLRREVDEAVAARAATGAGP